jgi:hypothetical protein
MRVSSVVLTLAFLAFAVRAEAASIGAFDWVHDVLFESGSVFAVINESADTFEDAFVDLYAPAASTPFQTLSLGDISRGGFAQSTEDLSFLIVPFELERAQLRLTYQASLVTADLFASSLIGDPDIVRFGSTSIEAPTTPPTSVPEPATLLLLFSSAVGIGVWRNRNGSESCR